MIINFRKISNTGLLRVIECFYTIVVVVVLLPFKWSEHFFHHWCLITYFQILYLVLTTQSSVNNKHAPQGKKFETMVLASAPAAWWMMAVLRNTCFVGPLTSRSKKKKKCETMGLISLVGSPEPSVLRIRERSTITTKHLWKDQEKHLPTSLSQWCSVCSDLNWYCEWSVRVFYVKDFSSLIRVQYDTFLELAEATAEIETSFLLTGLVINCHVRLFVMTLNTNPSDLSHANLS